jgi:CheY-like chemotaxis protein
MTDLPIRMRHEQAYVLVVDEDRRMRRLLQLLLEHDGNRTATCASGDVALALIAAEQPDLIVIDGARQPSAEGALAGLGRDFGPIPTILLTAKRGEQGIQAEPASRAAEHVGDPFRSVSLLTLVRAVLRCAQRFDEATPSRLNLG